MMNGSNLGGNLQGNIVSRAGRHRISATLIVDREQDELAVEAELHVTEPLDFG